MSADLTLDGKLVFVILDLGERRLELGLVVLHPRLLLLPLGLGHVWKEKKKPAFKTELNFLLIILFPI